MSAITQLQNFRRRKTAWNSLLTQTCPNEYHLRTERPALEPIETKTRTRHWDKLVTPTRHSEKPVSRSSTVHEDQIDWGNRLLNEYSADQEKWKVELCRTMVRVYVWNRRVDAIGARARSFQMKTLEAHWQTMDSRKDADSWITIQGPTNMEPYEILKADSEVSELGSKRRLITRTRTSRLPWATQRDLRSRYLHTFY